MTNANMICELEVFVKCKSRDKTAPPHVEGRYCRVQLRDGNRLPDPQSAGPRRVPRNRKPCRYSKRVHAYTSGLPARSMKRGVGNRGGGLA